MKVCNNITDQSRAKLKSQHKHVSILSTVEARKNLNTLKLLCKIFTEINWEKVALYGRN